MKTKFKYIAIFAVLGALLVMPGCQNGLFLQDEPSGNFILTVNNNGRTILPAGLLGEIDWFELSIYAFDEVADDYDREDPYYEDLDFDVSEPAVLNLDLGMYLIEVYGFNGDGEEVAFGKLEDLVIPNVEDVHNINLTPIFSGEGFFAWDFTNVDDSIVDISLDWTLLDENGEDTATTGSDPLEGLTGSIQLDAGVYRLIFTLDDGTDTITWREILHVYKNLTSTFAPGWDIDFFTQTLVWQAALAAINADLEDALENIALGHFIAAGIAGVNAANLDSVKAAIIDYDNNVADIATLKILADVGIALFILDAELEDAEEFANDDLAVAAIKAILSSLPNASALGSAFSWDIDAESSTVSFTIGGIAASYTFDYEIVLLNFDITVAGETQTINISEMLRVNAVIEDIPNGYIYKYSGAGQRNSFATFKVDLGSKTLADFEFVSFTFHGVSGDVGWKNFYLLAANSIPDTTPIENTALRVATFAENTGSAGTDRAQKLIIPLEGADNIKAKALTGIIDVAIFSDQPTATGDVGGAGSQTVYRVTNINFVLGDLCDYCDQYPCICIPGEDLPQMVQVKIRGGDVDIIDDGNGFVFTKTSGYEAAYPWFAVDFSDLKLSDFDRITLTYQGVLGDVGWKTLQLIARDEEFPDANINPSSPFASYAYSNNGQAAMSVSLSIDPDKAAAFDDNDEVYFSFYLHAGSELPIKYSISNVKFVNKVPTEDNIVLEFTDLGNNILTSNIKGTAGGYSYEFWKSAGAGPATMTLGSGGTFSAVWEKTASSDNFLFRRGRSFNPVDKVHKDVGYITIDFDAEFNPSADGAAYLCVYGWTIDSSKDQGTDHRLVEYYIVESMGPGYTPTGEAKGSFTVDGSVYNIHTSIRAAQPSIEGTATFLQYWSIRQTPRVSGEISVSEHFLKWEELGMPLGNLYEVALTVEGYNSSGAANVTHNVFTITEWPPEEDVVVYEILNFADRTINSWNQVDGNIGIANTNATLEVDGDTLKVIPGGNYAGAVIGVGTANGGDGHGWSAGSAFNPQAGKTYEITIKMSGTSSVRMKINNSDAGEISPTFTLSATPTDYKHTFTFVSHDIVLDAPTGVAYNIHSIVIVEKAENTGSGFIFDMQDLTLPQAQTHFAGLNNRGQLTVTEVAGDLVVTVTNWGDQGGGSSGGYHDSSGWGWAPVTILRSGQAQEGDVLKVSGEIVVSGGSFPINAGQMGLYRGTLLGGDARINDNGNNLPQFFELTHTLTGEDAEANIQIRWNLFAGAFANGGDIWVPVEGAFSDKFALKITSVTVERP
ncbi:MAG: glycoside hydrolase family 11 protein [Treponema sp.]|nr:glycoside hydrolase family 11 protein [Treponema sp.]